MKFAAIWISLITNAYKFPVQKKTDRKRAQKKVVFIFHRKKKQSKKKRVRHEQTAQTHELHIVLHHTCLKDRERNLPSFFYVTPFKGISTQVNMHSKILRLNKY